MAYISNTTAFCIVFLALYTVFSQVEAKQCYSDINCPTSEHCCRTEFGTGVCKYSCIGKSCAADNDCASGECCDVDDICKKSGNCEVDLPGWIVAVIIIVVLVVTAAFFFCICCAPSVCRRRAHNGIIIRLPTTTGNAVRSNQQQQYVMQQVGNPVLSNQQQQYPIQQGRPMHFQPNRNPPRPYPPQGRAKKQNANDPLIAQGQK